MTEPREPEPSPELRPDPHLDPAEVEADAPHAVVDTGTDRWPPLIDDVLLIPVLWRKVQELETSLRDVVQAQGEEINAIETVLGVNPQGAHATVADRITALENR